MSCIKHEHDVLGYLISTSEGELLFMTMPVIASAGGPIGFGGLGAGGLQVRQEHVFSFPLHIKQ